MSDKSDHELHTTALIAQAACAAGLDDGPYRIVADVRELLRLARGVASRAVRACNGEGWEDLRQWTETDDARRERSDKRAHLKTQEIVARYGATTTIGGDPRGYVVRLHLKSGRKNGMGDGWGVA